MISSETNKLIFFPKIFKCTCDVISKLDSYIGTIKNFSACCDFDVPWLKKRSSEDHFNASLLFYYRTNIKDFIPYLVLLKVQT